MVLFTKKRIYNTTSLTEQLKARKLLNDHDVQTLLRIIEGKQAQYEIYVNRCDYEKASSLLMAQE